MDHSATVQGAAQLAPLLPAQTGTEPSARVHGIDGLRAFAALWVVVFHMGAFSGGALWPGVDLLVRSGSTAVSLFLVLSGLCLYLPFAGGRSHRFRAAEFYRRRVRRLLPAYFASMAAVILALVLADGRWGMHRYDAQEMAVQTLTHATLTHQLFPTTFYGLNGAYWSLGLEWELYLTLPLLVWAAVRFGLMRTVAAVFAVTATYRLGLHLAADTGRLDADGPWATVVLPNFFLGRWSEFALGMVAAEWFRTRGTRVGWPQVLLAASAAVVALLLPDNPLNHILYGIVFFTLVCVVLAGDNVVARIFSWRPLVAIGVMSYSLYLVHQPIVEVAGHLLSAGVDDPRLVFLLMLLVFPVLLAVAFVLFVTVERRSLVAPGAAVPSVRSLLVPPGASPRPRLRAPERWHSGLPGVIPAPGSAAAQEEA